jgi:hypothetical protein
VIVKIESEIGLRREEKEDKYQKERNQEGKVG